MPPGRKKSKANLKASPAVAESSPVPATPAADHETTGASAFDPVKDPWTNEQATSLYKGVIQWKPTGLHKHFRMLAISEYMRNHGYNPEVEEHTRIPGIWEKLGREYNLPAIDERETPSLLEEQSPEQCPDFSLPDSIYGEMMFMRGQRSTSEPSSDEESRHSSPAPKRKRGRASTISRKRASTVEETDEAGTPPISSSPAKVTRAGRKEGRATGRAKAEESAKQQEQEASVEDTEQDDEAEDDDEDEDEEPEADEETEVAVGRAVRTRGRGGARPHMASRRGKRKRP